MIRAERDRDLAILLLDRPDKRNALMPDMLAGLQAAIRDAEAQGARALLLAGEGRVFCGGFDLKQCLDRDGTLSELLSGLSATIMLLRRQPLPVVIAAHGAAIAGGCALLGGADVVIADEGAKFGYPVVPLGISPAVSAPFLREAVGDGRCRARLLDPDLVSGREALRLGLVHEVVKDAEQVRPRALQAARDLAAKPPLAVAATRERLREIEKLTAENAAQRGLEASLGLVGCAEEQQRLAERFGGRERDRGGA